MTGVLTSSRQVRVIELAKMGIAFAMTKESEDKKEIKAREGAKAWADYQAQSRAKQEKTARLRALRLARDAAKSNLADTRKKN
jgi:hypothetical protein